MQHETTQTITVKQLRRILFHIDNQDMTIRTLREKLYQVEDQDAILIDSFSMWYKLGVEK